MYAFRNPPPEFLEKELEPFPGWILWQALSTPLLAVHSQKVTPLGQDRFKLTLVVENRGWLPTYLSKKGLERSVCREITAELVLPNKSRLVFGNVRERLGHLEGIAHKPVAPVVKPADYSHDRAKVEWVVEAPGITEISARVFQERSGTLEVNFFLREE